MGFRGGDSLFGGWVKGQKYAKLRKEHQTSGTPFEDPEFPANDKSMFYMKASPGNIEWKRPGVS